MRIDRKDLIKELQSVKPGLSVKDEVMQSGCFVFQDGKVITFNEEICCKRKTMLKINGAVKAHKLLLLLEKLNKEIIDIDVEDSQLKIKISKKSSAGIAMEKDIELPLNMVDDPGEWSPVSDDFLKALSLVRHCASKDPSKFYLMCVHITPKWVEAASNWEIGRFKTPTGIEGSILIPAKSAGIVSDEMEEITKFSITDSYIHFKNKEGLILSCRRYIEDFNKLTEHLKVEGKDVTIPKGAAEAAEKAEIFAREDDSKLKVRISEEGMRIHGAGMTGWYTETKSIEYSGEPMEFRISAPLLTKLVKEHNDFTINTEPGQERLKLVSEEGKFVYVAVLHSYKKKESKKDDDSRKKDKNKREED